MTGWKIKGWAQAWSGQRELLPDLGDAMIIDDRDDERDARALLRRLVGLDLIEYAN